MKSIVIIVRLCTLLIYSSILAQSESYSKRRWSFGPQIGSYSQSTTINKVTCDSIVGYTLNEPALQMHIGAFLEYTYKSTSLRMEVNYMDISGVSTLIYSQNKVDPILGPEQKAIDVLGNKIEIPITALLRLPGSLKPFQVFGGISSHFNKMNISQIDFSGRNPGVEDVGNALQTTYKKYTTSYVMGVELDVRRFFLSARYQRSFGSVVNDIHVWENRYSFATRQAYLHATLGYRLYSLRFKNKDLYKYR